jgi:alkaline phosphatase
MTTTTVITQIPNNGAHYGPARSMLKGTVSDHDNGMAELATDAHGQPLQFDPRDYEDTNGTGMMVLWNDTAGGAYPWDANYYGGAPTPGFDPHFMKLHATDSASTAGAMATGHKAAVNMQSVDLYERHASTLVEDAMYCGKAAGVVSSVPILHATPGAFITHSNYRKNGHQMQTTMMNMNPTLAAGWCASRYQPNSDQKMKMKDGVFGKWTVLEQNMSVSGADMLARMTPLDPDNGDHVLACWGGEYTTSGGYNAPYRGVDSSYNGTWRTSKTAITNADGHVIGFDATTTYGNHYNAHELHSIPPMKDIVRSSIEFLGKDDDGFFLMYEQGDIDWAAHDNHMDNMLGTMLDIDEGVGEIIDWINNNGGWDRNALYVTADHDHYLTLKPSFPERLANLLIDGMSHQITPNQTIGSGYATHSFNGAQTPLSQLSTWARTDIDDAGHFWGVEDDGGNAWDSHTMRPVPVSYQGDTDNCIASLKSKGYNVLGKKVAGSPNKIDQVHLHACMLKALMGY